MKTKNFPAKVNARREKVLERLLRKEVTANGPIVKTLQERIIKDARDKRTKKNRSADARLKGFKD